MAMCKRCQKPIKWGARAGMKRGEPGAFVPLDPQPSPQGLYAIVGGHMVVYSDAPKGAALYIPHSVFCEAEGKTRRTMVSP